MNRCDGEFDVAELGLKAIPEGDWFCDTCTAAKKSTKPAAKGRGAKAAASKVKEEEPAAETSSRRSIRKK